MSLFSILGFGPTGWGKILLLGVLTTVAVTFASLLLGAVFGTISAAAKLSGRRAFKVAAETYTTVFRGVPELLVIYLIYFGGSSVVTAAGRALGFEGFFGLPSFIAGALAVGLISGAYQSEVYRGAFMAIVPGEIEAARAIGMSRALRFRRIIAPQILRFALPGLGNVWQLSLKDSALVSVTGLAEIMRSSQVAAGSTRQYFLFYIVGAILFLVLTSLSDQLFGAAEKRTSRSLAVGLGRS